LDRTQVKLCVDRGIAMLAMSAFFLLCGPSYSMSRMDEAIQLYVDGELEEALRRVEQVLAEEPNHVEASELKTQLQKELGLEEARLRPIQERDALREQVSELEGELERKRKAIEESTSREEEMQSALASVRALLEEMKSKEAQTQGKLAETEERLGESQERLAATEGKLSETTTTLAETKNKLAQTQAAVTETEGKLETSQGKLAETEERLGAAQEKIQEWEQANAALSQEKIRLHRELAAEKEQHALSRGRVEEIQREADLLRERLDQLERKRAAMDRAAEEMQKARNDVASARDEVKKVKDELEGVEQTNEALRQRLGLLLNPPPASVESVSKKVEEGKIEEARAEALLLLGEDPTNEEYQRLIMRLNKLLLVWTDMKGGE